MSSSDFRQIAVRADHGKAERLFRAAVTAFCSLTRPSRREIAQLEDLTLRAKQLQLDLDEVISALRDHWKKI